MNTVQLYDEWMRLKDMERSVAEQRRGIEDELIAAHKIDVTQEGTETINDDQYQIKFVRKLTRKVDAEVAKQIAIENGLDDQLARIFRWRADIDAKNWQATDPALTSPFLPAITTKPARPTVAVTIKE